MASPLAPLVDIITSQVKTLEAAYAKAGQSVPGLDDPFIPGPMDADMAVDMTKRIIVAAAAQLIATVRSPPETLQLDCTGTYTTAVLGVIEDANVADILMEAGPQASIASIQMALHALIQSIRVFMSRILPLPVDLTPRSLVILAYDLQDFKLTRPYSALPSLPRDQTHLQRTHSGRIHEQPHIHASEQVQAHECHQG